MHYSSLCSKILIIRGNIWTNRPVHGLLACYKRSYRILFFTIFSSRNGPSQRLNNNRNTSALMPERGKIPPSNVNPQPSLFELKETTFSSLRATRPFITIPLYLTFPLFPVSFLVWKLSRIRALLLGDHYPSLIIIFLFFLSSTEVSKFVFSCKIQALEEFILFSLELVRKNYEKRSVEWGGVRTGWDERIIGTNLFS